MPTLRPVTHMLRSVTPRPMTRALLTGITVVSAFGAGAVADRAIVATPAWKHLGAGAWAAYSRRADLGNGLIVYPLYGVGLTALAIAAAVSHRSDRNAPRQAGPPIYLAAGCALGVMATTLKAAPIMLSVPGLGDDHAALREAFGQFTFWGVYLRGALGGLAFLSSLWAVAVYADLAGAAEKEDERGGEQGEADGVAEFPAVA